jgi:hypothetical protein
LIRPTVLQITTPGSLQMQVEDDPALINFAQRCLAGRFAGPLRNISGY